MTTIDTLPVTSRIWIYQSTRPFTPTEVEGIRNRIKIFASDWMSHGKPVQGSIEILFDRFIVMSINEADEQACGRSVDSSIRLMKELEQQFGLTLLDRMNVAYRKADGSIASCSMQEFEKKLADGEVNERTLVFNNTVHTISEFKKNWEIEVSRSWHARLLPR